MKIRFRAHRCLAPVTVCLLLACAIAEAKQQDKPADSNSDDHVYTQREVDEKAVLDRKSRLANLPSGHDCRAQQGTVALRLVLRKSGEVTDIVVKEKSGCESFDEKAVRAVQKLKFTPAKKDGSDVSQYLLMEFHYSAL